MRRSGRRRGLGAPALLALAALTTALLPGTAAAAAPDGHRGAARPAGVWDIWLERPGYAYGGTFALTASGQACGVGQGESKGFWAPLGAKGFLYLISAPIRDEQAGTTVVVTLSQQATLSGDTFAGSGTSYVHTLQGELVAAVPAKITGKRTSATAQCP